MRYDLERFIMAIMPLIIAMFCILVVSALCETRWLQIFLEIPVWAALIWWMWVDNRSEF